MRKKIIGYYNPLMPIYLARHMQLLKYDPDEYAGWIVKIPSIAINNHKRNLKYKIYCLLGYYSWIIYVMACLFIVNLNIFGAVIGIIISPLVVAGSLYWLAYSQSMINKLKPGKILKKN